MALKSDYDPEALKWLYQAISTGIDWRELKSWLARWEKPHTLARLINTAACGGADLEAVARRYVGELHLMMADGSAEAGMELVLAGPRNVHNALYYLCQTLTNGSLLTTLADVSPDRWNAEKGFVGSLESK